MKFCLFFILFTSFNSYGQYFPLTTSFGGAGRAAKGSSEYHVLNAASLIQKKSQATAFYSLDKKYGGSISSQQGFPVALTWLYNSQNQLQERVFSIAGRMNQNWILGIGVRYPSTQEISPHIGLIYQVFKNLRLGFTGDRIEEEFLYGFGFYYQTFEWLNVLADATFRNEEWNFYGGFEVIAQDTFSFRVGQSWPLSFYRVGVSLIGFPIKVDYTWTEENEHIFGIRIVDSFYK